MRNILYTTGSHGQFLKYLFDSYEHKHLLPAPFTPTGRSHNHAQKAAQVIAFDTFAEFKQANQSNTAAYEVCAVRNYAEFIKKSDTNYIILWEGFENFCYIFQCYIDRGGGKDNLGIKQLEQNVFDFENSYGEIPIFITDSLKKYFNFYGNTQPNRGLLRTYFLLNFFTYFENIAWKQNEQLKKEKGEVFTVEQILNYDLLKEKLKDIFDLELDFKNMHDKFIEKNYPLKEIKKIKQILFAIDNNTNLTIPKINVISEAYILFVLEKKHFDIPFLLGNNFFKTTNDILDYINYFPSYMKKPNNLFHKFYREYKRDSLNDK